MKPTYMFSKKQWTVWLNYGCLMRGCVNYGWLLYSIILLKDVRSICILWIIHSNAWVTWLLLCLLCTEPHTVYSHAPCPTHSIKIGCNCKWRPKFVKSMAFFYTFHIYQYLFLVFSVTPLIFVRSSFCPFVCLIFVIQACEHISS